MSFRAGFDEGGHSPRKNRNGFTAEKGHQSCFDLQAHGAAAT